MKKLIVFVLILISISLKSQTWVKINLNTSQNLNDVFSLNNEYGWIVGDSGTIFQYFDQSWHEIQTPITENLTAVHLIDSNNVWVTGENGLIINYKSGVFTTYSSTTSENLNDVYMTDSLKGWIVGDYGTLLKYEGEGWENETVIPDPLSHEDMVQIDFLNDTFGIAVGEFGAILEYSNEWHNETYMNTFDYSSVCIIDTNIIMVGRLQGTPLDHWHDIIYYPNGPVLFLNMETPYPVTSIDMKNDSGWAVSKYKEILKFNGSNFILFQSAGTPLNSVSILNDTLGWIVGDSGTLLQLYNTSSVDEKSDFGGFNIFPNPFNKSISINTYNRFVEKIDIYDILGRPVKTLNNLKKETNYINIDLGVLNPGVYFILFESEGSTFINKIIKE